MHAILSAKAIWAVAKDVEVIKKAWTASMMARKSRVGIKTYYGGGVVALGLVTFAGAVVRGAEGSRGAEDVGAEGSRAVEVGAGAENDGT